jgi:hypothetical protein
MTWHPLPSPGFPRVRFPEFDGTVECSDLLRPSRRTPLPSRGDTMRCVCSFAPIGPERRPRARGSSSGPHHRIMTHGDDPGSPRFLENPLVPSPCSPTPVGPHASGHYDAWARPPLCPQRRLPRKFTFRGSIARLWDSLFTLRPIGHPTRRQTRFRSLARHFRAGLLTRRVPSKSFRNASYISSPFPRLAWRKDSVNFEYFRYPLSGLPAPLPVPRNYCTTITSLRKSRADYSAFHLDSASFAATADGCT